MPYELSNKELQKLQKKSLEMLVYFRDFCNAHDLTFFLCGGACIGAVRGKGFIPWDDDVDVFMPRQDYERLRDLWEAHADTAHYNLAKPEPGNLQGNIFITVRDEKTTFIKPYQAHLEICHGIVLDVLPLDGCPSGFSRKLQKFWALIYSLFCAQIVPENHGLLVTLAGKILLGSVPSMYLRDKIWQLAQRHITRHSIANCEKITELCSGPFYMKKEYPKKAFETAIWVPFEGEKMPLPAGFDAYLREAFGDYRVLPPEENRRPHHDMIFCDTENSYKTYKGRYWGK